MITGFNEVTNSVVIYFKENPSPILRSKLKSIMIIGEFLDVSNERTGSFFGHMRVKLTGSYGYWGPRF